MISPPEKTIGRQVADTVEQIKHLLPPEKPQLVEVDYGGLFDEVEALFRRCPKLADDPAHRPLFLKYDECCENAS